MAAEAAELSDEALDEIVGDCSVVMSWMLPTVSV